MNISRRKYLRVAQQIPVQERGRSLERIKGQMIFVAEDEPLVSLDIADALRAAGANVVSAHNVKDALTMLRRLTYPPQFSTRISLEKAVR